MAVKKQARLSRAAFLKRMAEGRAKAARSRAAIGRKGAGGSGRIAKNGGGARPRKNVATKKKARKKSTGMVTVMGYTVRSGSKRHRILLEQKKNFDSLSAGEHGRGRSNRGRKCNPGRSNPVEAAAETYRGFHGREPDEIITVKETIREHTVLPGIGKLVFLEIAPVDGGKAVELSGFKGALLCRNEKKNGDKKPQLYVRGGDQSVDLGVFGIRQAHEREILGAATRVGYHTRKDHLDPRDGGDADYVHRFGFTRKGSKHVRVAGARLPVVVYDVRNRLLEFAGGGYTIPDEGIDG